MPFVTNGLVTKAPRGDRPVVTGRQPAAHKSAVGECLAARAAGHLPASVPAKGRTGGRNPRDSAVVAWHHPVMGNLRDIVIDCRHPASLARFWAAALDDYEIAPYDEDELARLREMGITSTEDDPSVVLVPLGAGPRLFFQLVPEPKTVKNRVHLDVNGDCTELLAMGATLAASYPDHQLLTDPEGNEFCVFP